ncbi:MAG: hydrogenase formation protein HypD [Firmicutes bacterium]|nr:hydrogenase formation protein HypD [Bacillota bacterium]
MTADGKIQLMEICGTHTMSIAKSGIRSMLPEGVELVSGPGCPVCVTPSNYIDQILKLSMRPDVIITTYGDMVRVPGSSRGDNLRRRMADGAQVRVVFSPTDAIKIAQENPDKQVVFLGVGFETTAPGTAAAVGDAAALDIDNFTILPMLKTCEPVLRTLAVQPDFCIDGFLCPGHVAVIIGSDGFSFLADEYHLPGVVAGFEAEDILKAVAMLLKQLKEGRAEIENEYTRAVATEGNPLAKAMIDKYLKPIDTVWRGLGEIPKSGLGIKDGFAKFDAVKRFELEFGPEETPTACRCGDVIKGKLHPDGCPLFGKVCTPEDPVGPCMVSSEGACAAAWKYRSI